MNDEFSEKEEATNEKNMKNIYFLIFLFSHTERERSLQLFSISYYINQIIIKTLTILSIIPFAILAEAKSLLL